jgi:cytochrome c oxidase assembly protein subunit 15
MAQALTSPALASTPAAARGEGALRAWLLAIAVLVFAMVVIGGATRLTGSGLSITEWKPVTGAVPPLTEQAWSVEFDKYRASPQYELLNKGMTIEEFREIYWWEWSHRQLGRLIGIVFGVGFIVFAGAGILRGRLLAAVAGIGVLGGLQGAIGWIMVASGLKPGMTAVAPVKLMLHLTVASLIFTALVAVWTGLRQRDATASRTPRVAAGLATAVLVVVLLQIALGALVAGSKAGLIYNDWPFMAGRLVPPASELLFVTPWYENFFDNTLTVQFNHRLVAYALLALVLVQAWILNRDVPGTGAARRGKVVAGLVLAQAVVGIATLVTQVPLPLALLHQGFAMVVLAMAAVHWRLVRA